MAAKAGAVVAYPSSFGRGWRNNGPTDVRFLTRVIADVSRAHRIDPHRVYVTGHSSGAFMTYRMACVLADRIAAIGPVAGAPVGDCDPPPAHPVAVIHVHGTADPRIPYVGGQAIGADGQPFGQAFPSAQEMVGRWVAWDRCATPSSTTTSGTVTTEVWAPCADRTEVRLVSLDGWPHTFPNRRNGAPIDAPATIWAFLGRFRR